ncbi:thioredoxin family protein [Myxococcaceae bacterium JPH2]|nr:thioredoxin family protein [Myxococcaceae bacterium JPH2]
MHVKTESRSEWLAARKELLAKEKALTQMNDELSAARREMPWLRVETDYAFEGPNGRETLSQLFAGRSQLIVYHFMFAPEWDVGCKSCSFWADSFNGVFDHVQARDATFLAISRAPLEQLQKYQQRMGWRFKWVSSHDSTFNFDFQVSFTPDDVARGTATYNYSPFQHNQPDMPGFSVFSKDSSGAVFHTYSTFARGIERVNAAYQLIDLLPKGRDENPSGHPMSWLRRRDEYGR